MNKKMTKRDLMRVKRWKDRNGNLATGALVDYFKSQGFPCEGNFIMTDEQILDRINALQKERNKNRKGKNEKGGKYWMADFETTTDEVRAKLGVDYTEVWAWAVCPIPCEYELKDCVTGTSIESFIDWMKENVNQDDVIFFHNLTFDGSFLLDWLLKHGFSQEKCGWKNKKTFKNFDLCAAEMAGIYSITLGFGKKGAFRIQDSHKLLSYSVAKIGIDFKTKNQKLLIDYNGHDRSNTPLTDEEKKYVCNDVLVVAQALWEGLLCKGYTKMTAGSNALFDYITRMGGKEAFREKFPLLDDDEDAFVRESYRGAISQVKKGIENKRIRCPHGVTVDKHSMYPSQMHSKSDQRFPIGKGEKINCGITEKDGPMAQIEKINRTIKENPTKFMFVKFNVNCVVKKNHMPFLQKKNNCRFSPNEFIEDTEGMIDICMMWDEFLLLQEQYDVVAFEFVDAIWYDSEIGLFDEYIDYWYNIKETSSGAVKQLAKLMLNSLYGKFATSIVGDRMEAMIGYNKYKKDPNDKDKKILVGHVDDNIVHYEHISENREPIYIPVGSAITAYARCDLVRSCQKNWKNFLYCDTDSMHLRKPPVDIPVTAHDICTWGIENHFYMARYIRQKTYLEMHVGGGKTVRCAGLPQSVLKEVDGKIVKVGVRELVTLNNFSIYYDFKNPNSPFVGCKLRRKTIQGGVVLVPCDFEIRGVKK